MDTRARLLEVASRGAPAQARKAEDLLTRLESDPGNTASIDEAQALFEAYLHDPYLVKIEPTRGDKG